MIKLVSESDPILKTEPSLWDFKNPLGIVRRLNIENDTWYKSGEVISIPQPQRQSYPYLKTLYGRSSFSFVCNSLIVP